MPAISPDRFDLDPALKADCETAIRKGSISFFAASRLLPRETRLAARALYSFCRATDDLIDEGCDPAAGLVRLRVRLDRIYRGDPEGYACDRAFAAVVAHYELPKALPEALIEGFEWDAEGRSHDTIDDVIAYSARVASSVGVMMAVIMGATDRHVLARAADLGIAMQLTNIARDVGEDARRGRVYLPLRWLQERGVDPCALMEQTAPSKDVRAVVKRVLDTADGFYLRALSGVAGLPATCRVSIRSAALIYREIGREIEKAGFDSVTRRARTGRARKVGLIARAASAPLTLRPVSVDPPHPALAFLVHAGERARPAPPRGIDAKAGRMIELMALSEQRRRKFLDGLI